MYRLSFLRRGHWLAKLLTDNGIADQLVMGCKWISSASLVLLFAATASAQVTAGDASLNLSGAVATGYSGSFGNQGPSSHGISFAGNGDLSGSYHSPQFLSFDVAPFYNQSRNDSNFQSITDSSGVAASANIFGGSKYPGQVNFSDVYNTEGNYLVPGIANYRTNGNGETFGVGWSAHPTDTLSFSTGYQDGNTNSSIYGATGEIDSHFRSMFATSTYTLDGFRLGGGVHHWGASYTFPQTLTGAVNEASQAGSTTYNLSLSRSVALDGSAWVNYTRNTTGYTIAGVEDPQTADILTGGITLKPVEKLSTSFSADYDDNLAGTIYQIANSTGTGAVTPFAIPEERSHSWGVYADTQYSITDQFYLSGDVTHRQQLFLGTSYNSTAYSGGVHYGRELFGGQLTAGTIATHSDLGSLNGSTFGLLSTAIYIRQFGAWSTSGSLSYSRNVQTLLIPYTTSGYSYSTAVNRRVGKLNWNGSASGSQTVVSELVGTNAFSQNYSTALSSSKVGVGAGYSRSSGLGLYTAEGIATVPSGLPPTLLSSSIHYGGTTYSVSLGSTPIRGLIFNGTFADTRSSTENGALSSNNHTQEGNTYLQYKFRKVFFTAGYSRLLQGFSASTLAPAIVSTYYVGVSRWFNFF